MNEEERITTEILLRDFALKTSKQNEDSFLQIRTLLIDRLNDLIEKNMEPLYRILYRIDIDEEKAHAALAEINPAERLADLIIERQIQKAKTRVEYKSSDSQEDYNVS